MQTLKAMTMHLSRIDIFWWKIVQWKCEWAKGGLCLRSQWIGRKTSCCSRNTIYCGRSEKIHERWSHCTCYIGKCSWQSKQRRLEWAKCRWCIDLTWVVWIHFEFFFSVLRWSAWIYDDDPSDLVWQVLVFPLWAMGCGLLTAGFYRHSRAS